MDVDGVDDPREESLNKTNPGADIIAFFKPLARVRGHRSLVNPNHAWAALRVCE